jgi:hypothetical protein
MQLLFKSNFLVTAYYATKTVTIIGGNTHQLLLIYDDIQAVSSSKIFGSQQLQRKTHRRVL